MDHPVAISHYRTTSNNGKIEIWDYASVACQVPIFSFSPPQDCTGLGMGMKFTTLVLH
jgi:hypothetical protein